MFLKIEIKLVSTSVCFADSSDFTFIWGPEGLLVIYYCVTFKLNFFLIYHYHHMIYQLLVNIWS